MRHFKITKATERSSVVLTTVAEFQLYSKQLLSNPFTEQCSYWSYGLLIWDLEISKLPQSLLSLTTNGSTNGLVRFCRQPEDLAIIHCRIYLILAITNGPVSLMLAAHTHIIFYTQGILLYIN